MMYFILVFICALAIMFVLMPTTCIDTVNEIKTDFKNGYWFGRLWCKRRGLKFVRDTVICPPYCCSFTWHGEDERGNKYRWDDEKSASDASESEVK